MLYDYRAIDPWGRRLDGRAEAGGLTELEGRLSRQHLELLRARPVRLHFAASGRIPRRRLITLCFNLEHMLRAGVPVLDILADLLDTETDPRLQCVLAGIIDGIGGGMSLSEAMAAQSGAFGDVMLSLIGAGETSGRLPEVLAGLGEALKWEDELLATTRRLLIYPALLAVVVVAAAGFLIGFMVPQLKLFITNMGEELPLQTRLLFALSDLLGAGWPALAALAVAAPLTGGLLFRHSAGFRERVDRWMLRLPLFGPILSKIVLCRFSNTLALLYAAGIPVLEAIETTRRVVGNRALDQALGEVARAIRDGGGIAASFGTARLFPSLVIRMLHVGESTGGLDQALRTVAYFYDRDVRESVGRMQAMLEPLLTLILGVLLGWIMLALFSPLYDVISRVRS